MEERLQKIIAASGLCSRRKAEQLITEGRVRLNGNTARLGDTAVEGEDVIEVDGKRVKKEKKQVTLLLHKPRGYVTTMDDEKGRKTVAELVSDCPVRVYPVGRLDLNSEGLLLMTNDGALAQALTHPKNEVEKVYLVWVSHYLPGAEKAVAQPMELDGRKTSPARVVLKKQEGGVALLEVTIHEGRNRQVRRLCEAAGLTVTRLKRIREGSLTLGDLPLGKWRALTPEELAALRKE